MVTKHHKLKDTPHYKEAVDRLRTAFALPLVKKYGTEEEDQRMTRIAYAHSDVDNLSGEDKKYRDELVVKYLPSTYAWTLTREMMVREGTICSEEELQH